MPIELFMVTPQGEVFAEPVERVVLPGSEGEFGVLESHERFLAPLKPGPVQIDMLDGRCEWAAIAGGFAQVTGERLVVLVDHCTRAHEIDLEDAERRRQEAERELAALEAEIEAEQEEDRRTAIEHALVTARVQIDVHARHHGH